MFYHLLYPLASDVGAFNVFRYITFRTGAATLTALFIAFAFGPVLIHKLASLRRDRVGRSLTEKSCKVRLIMVVTHHRRGYSGQC